MEQISQTRLAKELEMLLRMESKSIKINFSTDHKSLDLNLSVKGFPVTYYINLPERYPFLSPVVTVNLPKELNTLYSESSNLLPLILDNSWTPAISLQDLVERIILFNEQTLTTSSLSFIGSGKVWLLVLIGLVFRFAMFSQSYSGHYTPPLYGDYEAQRHWMELTANYPVEEWYKAEPEYWKLDYPPLTAWHSYLCGILSRLWEAESMVLGKSRGYYTLSHLTFMRLSVFVSEFLIYIPALIAFFLVFNEKINKKVINTALLLFLLSPPLLLIDYGHFQYNNVMLGFALVSILCSVSGNYSLAAAAMALSFNFKIMGLYYILPLVAYWLAKSYDQSIRGRMIFGQNLMKAAQGYLAFSGFVSIAGTGFIVCCIIWAPWLSLEEGQAVLSRIFPLDRGVFEDKVATFWCISSVIFKYKQIFSTQTMSILTGIVTLILSAPFMVLTVKKRSLKNSLLYGISGVSLTFFLFSYHVHEKTILVPLLPISLTFILRNPELFEFAVVTATFSMYPLFVLDRLKMPYFVFQLLFITLANVHKRNLSHWIKMRDFRIWYLGMGFVHGLEFVKISEHYPYMFELVVAGYAFLGFSYLWIFLLREHYHLSQDSFMLGKISKDKTR